MMRTVSSALTLIQTFGSNDPAAARRYADRTPVVLQDASKIDSGRTYRRPEAELRRGYADQLHRWLRPGGRLYALFVQMPRAEAADGFIQGPPYHCDIQAMRALFPEPAWAWPKPPYPRTTHPRGLAELVVVLERGA